MKDRNNKDEIEYVVATEITESSELFAEEDDIVVGDEQDWYEGDLQLAAELGKTLLERNRELEGNIKHQQVAIEDQALEIEYLSKQTAALKEVNESRLRVYEQLEVSLQDLEKSHLKLQQESDTDKKKIKSLNNSLDGVEKQCEDLQQAVDELRSASRKQERQSKRRERRRTLGLGMEFDAAELRRVLSVENGIGPSDHLEREAENLRLQQTVREMKTQRGREQKLREELELEIACLLQENEQFREQLAALQQRETVMKALQMELQEMEDEHNSQRLCSQCRRQLDDNVNASTTLVDNNGDDDDVEEDPSLDQTTQNQLTIVRLENGILAYGSQLDLANSDRRLTSPSTADPEEKVTRQSSLLSELDTQYRLLIEKYEAMINARLIHETGLRRAQVTTTSSRQRHDTGSEAATYNHFQPEGSGLQIDNSGEESGSLSSGFSDSSDVVGSVAHKEVQTDMTHVKPTIKSSGASRNPPPPVLLSTSQPNPLENHFNRTPEYKQLFQEIFAVLKNTVQSVESTSTKPMQPSDVDVRVDIDNVDLQQPSTTAMNVTNAKHTTTTKLEPAAGTFSTASIAFPALGDGPRESPTVVTPRLTTSPERTYADVVVAGKLQSRNWKPK